MPLIAVSGNGNLIAAGDTTPSVTDDTDFGTTTVGTPVTHTFTIDNTGTADLSIAAVSVAPGFTVTVSPSSPVVPGNSTTFDVRCDAASVNTYTVTVTVVSDASNTLVLYFFDVTCVVTAAPTIAVSGNGVRHRRRRHDAEHDRRHRLRDDDWSARR